MTQMRFKVNFDKLIADWPIKIVCLILAILLYVLHDITLLQQKVLTLPLTVLENGSMVVASPYLPRVKVTIRGNGADINTLGDNDISVYLDLNYYTEPGTFNVPVTTNKSSLAQAITPLEIDIEPKEVPLVLETRTFADVPVRAGFSGSPAAGYRVAGVSLSPSTLRIEGGSSAVHSVQELLTIPIPLDGKHESFEMTVATESVSQYIHFSGQSTVTASVAIEPLQTEKQFAVPLSAQNLAENLRLDSELPAIDITVGGTELSLERYSPPDGAVYADFSGITAGGTYDVPVVIQLPSYLTLVSPVETETVSAAVSEIASEAADTAAEEEAAASETTLPSEAGEISITMEEQP